MDEKYIEAISCVAPSIRKVAECFPDDLQKNVREISIRAGKPIVVSTFMGEYFFNLSVGFTQSAMGNLYVTTKSEIDECIRTLTEYSLHSFKREINMGFITIRGGHRAGIAGSCVYENGEIIAVNDISSVNLRIARQVNGVADELCRKVFNNGVCSVLIAGAPASGKTTMLKDICRTLAGGKYGYTKLSVIDERGELAAVYRGVAQNDIGITTDVFDGYKKGEGMNLAIRAMSPKALILDELSTSSDVNSVIESLNAGVYVIATAHASNLDELYRKEHICRLIASGAFQKIVLLGRADTPCTIKEIVTPKELSSCLK